MAEETPLDPQEEAPRKTTYRQDLTYWTSLADQRIEDAIQAGAFENLPGKGKPLRWEHDPNEPPDMAMANKLLKDNDLVPAWIEDRNEMLARIQEFRRRLQQGCERYRQWLEEDGEPARQARTRARWQRQVQVWQEECGALNKAIGVVNMNMPIWRMEILKVNLEQELARLGAGPEEPGVSP